MNTIYTQIRLENPCATKAQVVEVRALVDLGAIHLQLPAPIVRTLGLGGHGFRSVEQADGTSQECRYVGPVTLQCGGDLCFSGAVECGDEVVIGSLPLNALALSLDQATWQLVPVPVRV